jgi:hypothetical protein
VTHHLVGVAEVAQLLQLSPARTRRLVATEPDFPKPEASLVCGRVWSTESVERWRDERTHAQPRRTPIGTDYSVQLAGFDRLERPEQVRVVRFEVLTADSSLPFERHLPVQAADLMVWKLEEHTTPAVAERSLRWGFAHEGAAALGRQLEQTHDLDAVPVVDRLTAGQARRVMGAARRAVERQLTDCAPGTVLRVSAF